MKIFAIIVAALGFGGLLVVGGWWLYKKLTAVSDAASGAVGAVKDAASGELAYLKNEYGGGKELRAAEVDAADTKAVIQQTHEENKTAAIKKATHNQITIPDEITSDTDYKKKYATWQAANKAKADEAQKQAAKTAGDDAKLDATQADLDAFYAGKAAQQQQQPTTTDESGLGTWF